jgi:hypothetical protein
VAGWDQLTREQLLVVVVEQARLLDQQAAQIQALTGQVQALTEQVKDLTKQLGQNSGNSSMRTVPATTGFGAQARQTARRAELHVGDRQRPRRGGRPPTGIVRRVRGRSG